MRYFKEYLATMFEQYPGSIREDVPREFAMNHLVGSLAEAVKWWIGTRMKLQPEEVAEYYLKLIGYCGASQPFCAEEASSSDDSPMSVMPEPAFGADLE